MGGRGMRPEFDTAGWDRIRDALYEPALEAVRRLAEGRSRWALPWQSVHEFFGVATHPRIFGPPSSPLEALEQLSIEPGPG